MSQWYSIYSFLHPPKQYITISLQTKTKKTPKNKTKWISKKKHNLVNQQNFPPIQKGSIFKKNPPRQNGQKSAAFEAIPSTDRQLAVGTGFRRSPWNQTARLGWGGPHYPNVVGTPLLGNPKKKQALYIYIYTTFDMGISGTSIFSKIPRKQNNYHGYTVRGTPNNSLKIWRKKIKRYINVQHDIYFLIIA